MGVLSVILYTVAILIAILLICLVLVQPSKGGLGSTFGGVGEAVFGAQTMSHLSKLTVILITVFFVVTLALAAISGHKDSSRSTAASSTVLSMEQTDKKAEAAKTVESVKKAEPAKTIETAAKTVTADAAKAAETVKKTDAAKTVKAEAAKSAETVKKAEAGFSK